MAKKDLKISINVICYFFQEKLILDEKVKKIKKKWGKIHFKLISFSLLKRQI